MSLPTATEAAAILADQRAMQQWMGDIGAFLATGIPAGGTTGQVLTKVSGTDGDADWETPASGSSGGFITDSYAEYNDDGTITGKAYNSTTQTLLWQDTGLTGAASGSDISLVSGVPTINTTGIYAVTVTFAVFGSGSGVFNEAIGSLAINRTHESGPPAHDTSLQFDSSAPWFTSGSVAQKDFAFAFTGFINANDTIQVQTRLRAWADPSRTWAAGGGDLFIERLG